MLLWRWALFLKGDTPHFDYVCQGVTQGVIDVSLKHSKPIGYGVLMCNDLNQAIDRCGRATSKEDKGYDSAVAALELLHLQKKR
ncbi:6,7-dimethyl-8-ribityllumazine synthase [Actinomycetota bacterium]|nr:6,7-dimethyl-8-ribityllumazine synthase [Actinomycetota bacterium]